MTPKTDTGPQNKESPCLIPPHPISHGIFMSCMTTVIVLDLNISPKMLRYWNFILALVEQITERRVNEKDLGSSEHLSWIGAYNGVLKKWEEEGPCWVRHGKICLVARYFSFVSVFLLPSCRNTKHLSPTRFDYDLQLHCQGPPKASPSRLDL